MNAKMPSDNLTDRAAVAFVDLSGFTALTEAHGDRDAADLAEAFADLARSLLGEHDLLVKTIGDAIMVTSPTPQAALTLIGRLTEGTCRAGRFPVLHAGVNYGPIVQRRNDVYGTTVNIAARIAAAAGPGQTLATQPVADAARDAGQAVTALGSRTLRNLTDPVAVFAIDLGTACHCTQVDPVCRGAPLARISTQEVRHNSQLNSKRRVRFPHQGTGVLSGRSACPSTEV